MFTFLVHYQTQNGSLSLDLASWLLVNSAFRETVLRSGDVASFKVEGGIIISYPSSGYQGDLTLS